MFKSKRSHPIVNRKSKKILGDSSRVITRLHMPDDPDRVKRIIQRVFKLPDAKAESLLAQVMLDFADRHKDIASVFNQNLNKVKNYLPDGEELSDTKKH